MKIKFKFLPNGIKELLLGTIMLFFLPAISIAQVNLASANDLAYSRPATQLDDELTIQLKGATVKAVLDAIERQSDLRFVYDKSVLDYGLTFTLQEKKIRLH